MKRFSPLCARMAAVFLIFSAWASFAADVLTLAGNRSDKNAAGHGKNVAVYVGKPSRFFFATHEMGNIFSAIDGSVSNWFPHTIRLASSSVNGIIEDRRAYVTKDDVVVCDIILQNKNSDERNHEITFAGDCRGSFDWREKPLPGKRTEEEGSVVLLNDPTVYPKALEHGLWMAVGSRSPGGGVRIESAEPGTYRYMVDLKLRAGEVKEVRLACAFGSNREAAKDGLNSALWDKVTEKNQTGHLSEKNRKDWLNFFQEEVPQFSSSDRRLDELYAFRWFLLKFSTAGGDLGYFQYPVVMEGRQAYQTYCCYSAPFMGFDLNWCHDPEVGYGQIANMAFAAYEDGRFPWYTSPRTNRVKVHHESATGLSLLPQTAWKHYLVHGRKDLLGQLYPSMKKNLEWWLAERDANKDGIFQIAHQYETGMDDLHRWGAQSMTWKYDAVDATSYAHINLRAVEQMARVLGFEADARRFQDLAEITAAALNTQLFSGQTRSWRDRHPQTRELAEVLAITTFYPFFARAAGREHLPVLREHLLNTNQFWLAYPVPALAADQKDFDANGFWQGPSWPAATTHVLEGFARAAKELDRSLLEEAGELFRRAAYVHLQPRADFYERYNPYSGAPLSKFRDYMHSWWIDLYVQHVAGFEPQADGTFLVDPLPIGLRYFALREVPLRGQRVDVLWCAEGAEKESGLKRGLTVRVNGKERLRARNFAPGDAPLKVEISSKRK